MQSIVDVLWILQVSDNTLFRDVRFHTFDAQNNTVTTEFSNSCQSILKKIKAEAQLIVFA